MIPSKVSFQEQDYTSGISQDRQPKPESDTSGHIRDIATAVVRLEFLEFCSSSAPSPALALFVSIGPISGRGRMTCGILSTSMASTAGKDKGFLVCWPKSFPVGTAPHGPLGRHRDGSCSGRGICPHRHSIDAGGSQWHNVHRCESGSVHTRVGER